MLLVLENVKNNAYLENKSQNPNKPKGVEGKCKMDLSKYCIPKKACKRLVHWKLPEKQGEKHCMLCKKHGGRSKDIIRMTVIILTKMASQSRIVGAQVGLSLIRRGPRVQILCS